MDLPSGLPDIMSSMLKNPEIMKTISSIAENLQTPSNDDNSDTSANKSQSTTSDSLPIPPELLSQLPSIISSMQSSEKSSRSGHSSADSQRKELLQALRPFLSEKRCAVIDSILKFESLAGVISGFTDKKA